MTHACIWSAHLVVYGMGEAEMDRRICLLLRSSLTGLLRYCSLRIILPETNYGINWFAILTKCSWIQAGFIKAADPVATVQPHSFAEAAKRACGTKYTDIKATYPAVDVGNQAYLCLDLVYQYTLLVDGFGKPILDHFQLYNFIVAECWSYKEWNLFMDRPWSLPRYYIGKESEISQFLCWSCLATRQCHRGCIILK